MDEPLTYSKNVFVRHWCAIPSLVSTHTPVYWVETLPYVDQTTVATKYYSVVVSHCFPYATLLFLKQEVKSRDYIEHFLAHQETLLRDHFEVTAAATEQLQ